MARRGVQDHAKRRLEKLAAQQATVPESERLINRTDFNKHVARPVSVLTRQSQKNSRLAFVTTMSSPSVGHFNDVQSAEGMFQIGGPQFTCDLLRQFLEASALSRGGTLLDDVQSTRSLRLLIMNLFGAAQASGNPVDKEVKKNTLLWIDGDLVPRGLAHRVARKKPVALPQDITAFIQRLFDPRFMCTLPTTRDPLLIVLFTCLMVDCACRTSELLRPSMSEENQKAYASEHPEKIFVWESIEVFAFPPSAEGQSVELQARLTFQSMKDTGNKGYKTKVIPLRLLPSEYAAEDSLFWLITLGLIDQVFEDVATWADFERLQPDPMGLRVHIKSEMKTMPVFRTANRALASSSDPLVSKVQMGAQAMNEHLRDLSRFCGLEHTMLPNVLRRSSAYILANTTTKDERAARMGHTDKDQTYWTSYRNTTSTVDYQGLRHGLEQTSVAPMSSVFLGNSSGRAAPKCVSEEGMQAIHQDSQLRDLLAQQTVILDALVSEHGSLENARSTKGEQYRAYAKLGDSYSKRKSRLTEAKYKEEYKQYFADGAKATSPALAAPQPEPVESGMAESTASRSAFDRADIEQLLEADPADILDDVQIAIDPLLLPGSTEDATDSTRSTLPIDNANDVESPIVVDETITANSNASSPGTDQASKRSFAPRTIGRHTLVDMVPTMLYEQPLGGVDRTTLSSFFCDVFNHLHAADKFYPGQEPFAGTFDCRFCGEHFLNIYDDRGVSSAHLHTDICEAAALAQSILDDVQMQKASQPAIATCPLSMLTTSTPCKTTLSNARAFLKHTSSYHRDSSKRYVCNSHARPAHFDVQADLFTHAMSVHGAPLTIMECFTPAGKIMVANFIYFCPFCQVYIPRREELQTDHFAGHLQDFADAISAHGLAGVWMFNNWAHPAFCPFCAYDAELDLATRMHQYGDSKSLIAHIAGHLKTLDKRIPCPATAATPEGLPQCSEVALLDVVQMAAHLAAHHGLEVKPPKTSAPAHEPTDSTEPKRKKSRKSERTALGELDVNSATQMAYVPEDGKED